MAGSAKSRRDSVIEGCEHLQTVFKDRLEQLRSIWVEVGVSPEIFQERQKMVYAHLINLMDEMVEEESDMKRVVSCTISQLMKIIDLLLDSALDIRQHFCHELPCSNEPLLDQEQVLKTQVGNVCNVIFERLTKFINLRDQDDKLSRLLGVSTFGGLRSYDYDDMKQLASMLESYHTSLDDTSTTPDTELFNVEIKTPTATDLDHFEQCVNDKLNDKNCKIKQYSVLHTDCAFLIKKLRAARLEPKPEYVQLIDVLPDQVEETQNLHQNRLQMLNNAFEELQDRYIEFKETVGKRIKASYDKLVEYLEKTGASDRELVRWPKPTDDDLDEQMLYRYEREIVSLKLQYEGQKRIYDKIGEVSDAFHKVYTMNKEQQDSSFYSKYIGLNLKRFLSELNHFKKVIEKKSDLYHLIESYNSKHPSTPFYFCGYPVTDYIESREKYFKDLEEREKAEKKAERERKIEKEALYGTSPRRTPSKRQGGLMVAGSSPCKLRNSRSRLNINATGATPGRNTTASNARLYVHSSIQKFSTRSPQGRAGRPPLPPPKNNVPSDHPIASHRHAVQCSKPVRGAVDIVSSVGDDVDDYHLDAVGESSDGHEQIESYEEFQNHIHDNQQMHSSVMGSSSK